MAKYSYKVMMEHYDCLARRPVVFHDSRFLQFEQMQKPSQKHLTSQTCIRCNKNHRDDEYIVVDVERGEPDGVGGFYYRDVMPSSGDDHEQYGLFQ